MVVWHWQMNEGEGEFLSLAELKSIASVFSSFTLYEWPNCSVRLRVNRCDNNFEDLLWPLCPSQSAHARWDCYLPPTSDPSRQTPQSVDECTWNKTSPRFLTTDLVNGTIQYIMTIKMKKINSRHLYVLSHKQGWPHYKIKSNMYFIYVT